MKKWNPEIYLPFFKKDITSVDYFFEKNITSVDHVDHYDAMLKEILNEIKTKVYNFVIEDFQKSDPLRYLYEADIQADLAHAISGTFNDKPIIINNVMIGNGSSTAKNYKLHPIAREYPLSEKNHSGRFDIACINPFMVKKYIEWRLTVDKKKKLNFIVWELPVLVAIEIKYSTFGNGGGFDAIKSDVKKMKRYKADYHEHRNPILCDESHEQRKFTEHFQFIGLHFFQDDSYFDLEIGTNTQKIQPVPVTSIEFDHAYMINHENIYEVSSAFLSQ